jgi:hypothetical protein
MAMKTDRPIISTISRPRSAHKAHGPTNIRQGDRYDVILNRIVGGVVFARWEKTNPLDMDGRHGHFFWVSSEALEHELAAHGYKTRALSTLISIGCRAHYEARWPGWTIENKLERVGDMCVSYYRIARKEEAL